MTKSRKLVDADQDYPPEGHFRVPPDDVDWTRTYMRRIFSRIDCEGDNLHSALESLNSEQWKRLKNASRQHKVKIFGSYAVARNVMWRKSKAISHTWRKMIAGGFVSEQDVIDICKDGEKSEFGDRYSDAGCRFLIRNLLLIEAERCRNRDRCARRAD